MAQPTFDNVQSFEHSVSDDQESVVYSVNDLSLPEMDLWLYTVNQESLEDYSDFARK